MKVSDLIYDWNAHGTKSKGPSKGARQAIEFDDETLRDGLQSSSAKIPAISQKIEMLHAMSDLGIHIADIGYPSSGEKAYADVLSLAREIETNKLPIKAGCAARTVRGDIDPIIEISQKTGLPIEVHAFIGSSPIRGYIENWDIGFLLEHTIDAVDYVVKHGLQVMYVTEDTTRSKPEIISQLYTAAVEHGAARICLCDTVGHATPDGVKNLVGFAKKLVKRPGAEISIDWHGHNDRGLALINSLAALESGANRVHGTALGLGERAGNTPMELLLVNLSIMGLVKNDLSKLNGYCELANLACGAPLPLNYPVFGRDAFSTATGVHAAAIIKAREKKESGWLEDLAYSAVPARQFGREQVIEIGPMSGKANVMLWLKKNGRETTPVLVDKILGAMKKTNRVLSDNEIMQIIKKE